MQNYRVSESSNESHSVIQQDKEKIEEESDYSPCYRPRKDGRISPVSDSRQRRADETFSMTLDASELSFRSDFHELRAHEHVVQQDT